MDLSRLQGVTIVGLRTKVEGKESSCLRWGSPFTAAMEMRTAVHLTDVQFNLMIEDASGRIVINHPTGFADVKPVFKPGSYQVEALLPEVALGSGTYKLWTRVSTNFEGRSQSVDSEKMSLEVDGHAGSLGLLEIPCRWTWNNKAT